MRTPEARPLSYQDGWLRAGRWISSGPACSAYLVLMWAVAGGTGSLVTGPPSWLASSTLFEGHASLAHPLSLVLSLVWGPGLGSYLVATVILLVLGVAVERRLGSTGFAVIALATHASATLTLAVTTWALSLTSAAWADPFFAIRYGGPFVGVLGAGMARTTTLATLWRRRIRVGVLSLLATSVLFHDGGLSVLLLVGSITGLVLGRARQPRTRSRSAVGSVHEMRMLAAVTVASTAIGPLLAALSPNPTGPFAILGFLVAPVRGPRPEVVAQLCAEAPTAVACTLARLHQDPGVATTFMACLPALLLLVAAEGLRRGRRSAWLGAIFLEGLLAVVAVVDYVLTLTDRATVPATVSLSDEQPLSLLTQLVLPSVVPVAVIVLVLVLGRGLFRLRGRRGDSLRLARRVGASAAVCALLYVASGLLLPQQWSPTATVLSLLADLPLRLAPLELSLGFIAEHRPTGALSRLAYDWTGVTFWVITSILVLRSYHGEPHGSSAGRSRAQTVLSACGGGSIAWDGNVGGQLLLVHPVRKQLRYVPRGARRRLNDRRPHSAHHRTRVDGFALRRVLRAPWMGAVLLLRRSRNGPRLEGCRVVGAPNRRGHRLGPDHSLLLCTAVPRRSTPPWPRDRVPVLAQALPDRYAVVVAIGAGLAPRQGEIFGLAVEDVDFLRREVTVRRQVQLADSQLVFAPPKYGKERTIPVAPHVADALAAHMARFPPLQCTLPWVEPAGRLEAASLICSTREHKPINRNYFNTVWRKALISIGVTPTRQDGCHTLRHFFASVLLDAGESIKVVSEYLGHSDPGFTLRTYTHVMPDTRARSLRAIDAVFATDSAMDVPSDRLA